MKLLSFAAGRDRVVATSVAAAIALAWLGLLLWGTSPYSRFLDHGNLGDVHASSAYVVVLLVGGWVVMVIAMMLPTTWPLLSLFDRVTAARAGHRALIARLVFGYLTVWILFGAAVHVLDLGVHRLIENNGWLDPYAWLIGAGTLIGAGVYQFSSLKYRCLAQCRSPYAFIATHWRGRDPKREAFALGWRHGLFCLGCCWTLMLVMFAVGIGNLGWMFALGVVMAIEKNARWGRRLSAPIGMALMGLGLLAATAWGGGIFA